MNTLDIGNYIRFKREQKGWTQEKLAEIVEVSIKTVGNWEKGEFKNIKFENLEKLAKAFDVTPAEIQMGRDLPDMSQDDKQRLEQLIKDLDERIDDEHGITIRIEEQGLLTTQLGFYAFAIAVMAFFLAWYAAFPSTATFVIWIVMCAFGIIYMIFGKRWADKLEKSRQAEKKQK